MNQDAKFKIGRLITSRVNIDFPKLMDKLSTVLADNSIKVDYFITSGGFWDIQLENERITVTEFRDLISDTVDAKFGEVSEDTMKIIKSRIKHFSFGIDGIGCNSGYPTIQSVVMYNCQTSKIVNITGKSYPTTTDAKMNIVLYPFETHIYNYSKDRVLILGCHDLKLFSQRLRKVVKGERRKKVNQFDKIFSTENPNVILHHPHITNKYRTWNNEWRWIENETDCEFSSGIYFQKGKNEDIKKTIEKSKSESVYTFRY